MNHYYTGDTTKGDAVSPVKDCGISMVGDLMLQLRDTMSLIKADLGSVCVAREVRLD